MAAKPISTKPAHQKKTAKNYFSEDSNALLKSSKDLLPLLLVSAYAIIELLPGGATADVMGDQWFFISIVNLVGLGYLVYQQQSGTNKLSEVLRSPLSLIYFAFLLVAAISIAFAINKTESLVVFARLVNTAVMFIIIATLFRNRTYLFRWLAVIFSLILLGQSLMILNQFFKGSSESDSITTLIYSLKLNTGNKNILAAGLVFKITLALYCAYTARSIWSRLLFSIILLPAAIAVFLLNARASFLGLISLFLAYIIVVIILENKRVPVKEMTQKMLIPVLPVVLAFFLSGMILKNAIADTGEKTPYGTVTQRLSSISFTGEGSNARVYLWKAAADYISHHPLKGCGIGNWKLASIPYEREIVDDLFVSYHAHNDFLEITAETGIVGGLLYIALFACVLLLALKGSVMNNGGPNRLLVFVLPALLAYSVDGFFNFPMERPVMQLFFALLLAMAVNIDLSEKKEKVQRSPAYIFLFLTILISLTTAYISLQTSKSLRTQALVNKDMMLDKPVTTYEDIKDAFPSIPNMNAYTFPIGDIKAFYLIQAKKYDEALKLVNRSAPVNPYLMLTEFLKAKIFFETQKMDSALFYAQKAFAGKPRSKGSYEMLANISILKKDSNLLRSSFQEYKRYRNEAPAWNNYIVGMYNLGADKKQLIPVADSAIRLFPGDSMLASTHAALTANANDREFRTYFDAAMASFTAKDYRKAIDNFSKASALNPDQYLCQENIGLCYYSLGQYQTALSWFEKVISLKKSNDGKSEFFKGTCLISLSRISEACPWLNKALEKNYMEARSLIEKYCSSRNTIN